MIAEKEATLVGISKDTSLLKMKYTIKRSKLKHKTFYKVFIIQYKIIHIKG